MGTRKNFTKKEREFIEDYMSLPDEERRFFKILIRIGAAKVLSDEEYSFFIQYLWRLDIKRLQDKQSLEGASE